MRFKLPLAICIIECAIALKVLQVTDFHLDVDYSTKGDRKKMCHVSNAVRDRTRADRNDLGIFGDYACDSPETLVKYAISEAKRLVPDPDLILWTGDNTPHVDGYSMDYVIEGIAKTTKILFSEFPKTHILPTFGNHDYAPANDFDEKSTLYHQVYYNLWKDQVGDADKDHFLKGGYYSHQMANSNQKILVLNTNLYYEMNQAFDNFTDPFDPAGQFHYLEQSLMSAEKCRKSLKFSKGQSDANCAHTVHIVAHIGPGAFERTPNVTWFRPPYNDRFLAIIDRFSASVGWLIFGHHHTDTWHIVRDSTGEPKNVAWMAPAVTPWFSDLPGAGANNPTFRVYEVDDKSGAIIDFTTYRINLDTLNQKGKAEAVQEYSMRQAYSLPSLSPTDMAALVGKFEDDDSLFMKYITYNSAGWQVKLPEGIYRQAQLCSLKYADFQRYFACMEEAPPAPSKGVQKADGIVSMIFMAALFLL